MPAAAVDTAAWTPVIGLEVHAQLATETKLFCGCTTVFGRAANTQVCPVCLGLPGALPVMNEKAFRFALKAALALNCSITRFTKWDRKNYYYPDLPKNYQISQYDLPFATKGWLEIDLDAQRKRIGITRVHLEEDAGKLLHDESGAGGDSGVDLNRAGTPLIEIVSEPDLRSPAEARAYMEKLAQILEYLGVCDCNMQEGSLRCDANVSIREDEAAPFRTRREIKNMNSFRFVEQAITAEIAEQKRIYAEGGTIQQSTRLFNGQTGEIRTMRTKEEASDYRYFPEPDLPPVTLTGEQVEALQREIGELPEARQRRYMDDLKLLPKDAEVLVAYKEMGDYFEAMLPSGISAKAAANWIISDAQGILKDKDLTLTTSGIGAATMAGVVDLIQKGTINRATAKEKLFPKLLSHAEGKRIVSPNLIPLQDFGLPASLAATEGMIQISDPEEIEKKIEQILNERQCAKLIEDYLRGKDAVVNAIFGQCMKAFAGKGNPQVIRPLLEKKLQEIKAKQGG